MWEPRSSSSCAPAHRAVAGRARGDRRSPGTPHGSPHSSALRRALDPRRGVRSQRSPDHPAKEGTRSLDAIERAFREGNADVRKLAIDATARWDSSEVDGLYEAALADEDINVRMAAVENIGEHGRSAFRERLEELLRKESNPMLVATLLSALLAVGLSRRGARYHRGTRLSRPYRLTSESSGFEPSVNGEAPPTRSCCATLSREARARRTRTCLTP